MMGLFTQEASEERLKMLKERREAIAKELELREQIAKEEKALAAEEKRLKDLKQAKWLKKLG